MSWKRFFRRRRWDQERARELEAYLQIETDSNVARGMTPEGARASAHRKLGNATQIREEIYRMNSFSLLESFWQDLRFGLRLLRKTPGFTLVALFTLALAIGADSTMFSVVNGVVLRPLPYPEPGRLVMAWTDLHMRGLEKIEISAPEYVDFRDHSPFFSGMAAFSSGAMTLTGRGDAESLIVSHATPNLFSVLAVRPLHGRTFLPEEATSGHGHVAVLSYAFWQTHFGAAPGIIGQSITLDRWPYTVIGVMPPGFVFPDRDTQLWTPQVLGAKLLSENNRGSHFLQSVARLSPGLTLAEAQGQLNTLSERMARDHHGTYPRGYSAHLTTLQSEIVGNAPRALWILLATVSVVLLIACANIANLLLARATVRRREVALRSALGAGRLRLVLQFMTESALLAFAGGAAGFLLAYWGAPAVLRLGWDQIPRAQNVHMDWRVALFTCAVSTCTLVIFGIIPALQSSSAGSQSVLKEGGANTTHSSRTGLREYLVIAEMAAALVLLVGAGLLLRSFLNVTQVDSGFAPSHLLTFRVPITSSRYPGFTQRAAFYRDLLERLAHHAGVQSTGAINALPFSGFGGDRSFLIEGRPVTSGHEYPDEQVRIASVNYFRTMGISLLYGRNFSPHDTAESPRVAIVDRAFVDRYWPGESALGKRLAFGMNKANQPYWCEIVGVVGNVHHGNLESAQAPQVYLPMLQPLFSVQESSVPNMFIAVRTSGNPGEFVREARAVVAALAPAAPLTSVMTMDERIAESESSRRFETLLLIAFAGMALLLASLGIYGVTSYTVQQRQQEFGLRTALGAQAGDILRLVLVRGARMILWGIGCGIVTAAIFARALGTLLFQVRTTDPWTLIGGTLFLAVIALLGCALPARRAMRADPMAALRVE